jgi:hypothetical protein
VPLVLPVARAGQRFDDQGRLHDAQVEEPLRLLGREVVRAARQCALEPPTKANASQVEDDP